MDAIKDLVTVLLEHPEFAGSIDTDDVPVSMLEATWEALEGVGDDLSQYAGHPCRGHSIDGRYSLVLHNGDEGWRASLQGSGDDAPAWNYVTPKSLEFALRKMVGNRNGELVALRDAIEDVWQPRFEEARKRNEALSQGWHVLPSRTDDDVLAEAMLRYRKAR